MMQQSNDERVILKRLSAILAELHLYVEKKEQLRENKKMRYTVERLFIKVGELMVRLRSKESEIYKGNSMFEALVRYRNKLAHTIETDLNIVIKSLIAVPLLQENVNKLIENYYSTNEVFSNFENFGGFGTKRSRKALLDAILNKIKKGLGFKSLTFPKEKRIMYISDASNKLTNDKDLLQLSAENDEIAIQITEEIAKWAKQTYKDIHINYPYEEEQELFDRTNETGIRDFIRNFDELHDELLEIYQKGEIAFSFYKKQLADLNSSTTTDEAVKQLLINASNNKVKKIDDLNKFVKTNAFQEIATFLKLDKGDLSSLYKKVNEKKISKKEALKSSFLGDWNKALTKKQLNFELEKINQSRSVFSQELYNKIAQYKQLKKLLSPFISDVGRLWDMSKGVWNNVGFEVLQKYADLLDKDEQIKDLAELLGRFRKIEKEQEEELIEKKIIRPKQKIEHAQKSELVGIVESNDINNLFPSEIALLANKATEDFFYKKFLEKKLLSFEYESKRLEWVEEKNLLQEQKEKEQGKGPIIICVDTSASMQGAPERIAKLICFAVLKIACQDLRQCYLISFSDQIETLALTEFKNSLDRLVDFLKMSFYGGTDISLAFIEALKMLETNDFQKADVLFISDFIMPELEADILERIKLAQSKNTQFHSLTISHIGNENVFSHFNHNWVYNPSSSNSLLELVSNLKAIQKSRVDV